MTVSTENVLLIIGGCASVATGIFWGSFYIGRIWAKLADHDRRLADHEERLDELAPIGRRR